MRTRRWPEGHQGPSPKFNGTRDNLRTTASRSFSKELRTLETVTLTAWLAYPHTAQALRISITAAGRPRTCSHCSTSLHRVRSPVSSCGGQGSVRSDLAVDPHQKA